MAEYIMEKYLKVGQILKTQGLKGEVRVFSTTSFKDIRYKKGNELFILLKDGTYKKVIVNSFYTKGENLDVISFKSYDSIELIEPFVGLELCALKDENILFDDEYFYEDLKWCKVYDEENNELGEVASVEEFPAQETLKILGKNKKFFFIPFNDFFVKDVDVKNKEIIIHVIEGLIE